MVSKFVLYYVKEPYWYNLILVKIYLYIFVMISKLIQITDKLKSLNLKFKNRFNTRY